MGAELMSILDIVIALSYFLLSFIILVLPFAFKSLRVLGVWGIVIAFHCIVFLSGCGIHHVEWSTHGQLTIGNPVTEESHHFLIPGLMQVYGALGVAAVVMFRGRKLTRCMTQELIRVEKAEDL